ncbi:hypothetical protein I6N95_18675 [Vagococcus sp. BWB3-3]|uniref:Uncharacterized protein n=1 Tax=Vagococcus allomyrinae TaxID=2794353 RepID=A0A940PDR1_9ENTE|nr:hypothetical protein [Vagococcus allomyrinae]MBP1043044.1 hypothetical protein [Vagococcus allomyrinae]
MATTHFKNLNIVVNQQEYLNQDTYVTLAISGGFCTKEIYLVDDKKRVLINQASSLVLGVMVKKKFKEVTGKRLRVTVNKNSLSFTLKTKPKKFDDYISQLLKVIYSEAILDEELFEYAKKKVQIDFGKRYGEAKLKSYYTMLEFSEQNKQFKFAGLAEDIKDITYAQLLNFKENMVQLENSSLFVNGYIENESENIVQFIEKNSKETNSIQIVIPEYDPYLEMDSHLFKFDTVDFEMGCIRLNFIGSTITLEERYLLLNFIGVMLFGKDIELSMDVFDTNITYIKAPLKEYKFEIEKILLSADIEKLKTKLLSMHNYTLVNKPYVFNNLFSNLTMNHVDYTAYLSLLIDCDKDSIATLYRKSNIKITEAHELLREREWSANV